MSEVQHRRRLADLPLRIRVHVADGNVAREFAARRTVQWLDDVRFEFTCADDGKIEAIRSVSLLATSAYSSARVMANALLKCVPTRVGYAALGRKSRKR